MSSYVAEMLGTMLLIILGDGVVAGVVLNKTKSHQSGWIVIAFGWGLAVMLSVYAFGGISGAHINPAVTIGLATSGDFPWSEVPYYVFSQMAGAFLGAIIVYLHYLPHFSETDDASLKRAVFCTDPAIKKTSSNLVSEIIGTMILLFCILSISNSDLNAGFHPMLVGILVLSIGLSLGGTTGYAINPARDFGPRLAHFLLPISGKGDSGFSYAFVPIVGPIIGGILGVQIYKSLFSGVFGIYFWTFSAITLIIMLVSVFVRSEKKLSQKPVFANN